MSFHNDSTGEVFDDEDEYLRSLKRDDSYTFEFDFEYVVNRFAAGDDDVELEVAHVTITFSWDDTPAPGYVVSIAIDSPTPFRTTGPPIPKNCSVASGSATPRTTWGPSESPQSSSKTGRAEARIPKSSVREQQPGTASPSAPAIQVSSRELSQPSSRQCSRRPVKPAGSGAAGPGLRGGRAPDRPTAVGMANSAKCVGVGRYRVSV